MALSLHRTTEPAAPEESDPDLVRRLRGGDLRAGEVLAQRYEQPLLRYLHRLVRSENQAEDLYQATWLSVLEHLDKFDLGSGAGGFKAWLFRIATNKANDHWRSRGRERTAHEGLRLVVESQSPHAGAAVEDDEQVRKLLRVMDRLPEQQRQVLLLRYYSELKFVEIAEMLGCPLNTALGRMHKAIIKLRELMEE